MNSWIIQCLISSSYQTVVFKVILITNFTEFVFYKQEDIDDYLSVLESVPAYIEGALEVTRTQVQNGYFMTDDALDSTLDGIEKFVAKTDNNPLIQIF